MMTSWALHELLLGCQGKSHRRTFLTYLKSFHITELRRKAPLRIDGISLQNAFKGCVLENKCKN